jgi:hypothetical protein
MVAGAIGIEPESATELLLSVASNFGFHDVSYFDGACGLSCCLFIKMNIKINLFLIPA